MKNIKSKFTWSIIIAGAITLLFLLPAGVWFMYGTVQMCVEGELSILGCVLISLLIAGVCLVFINGLKFIRHIIIKEDRLTYYSPLCPCGKTLYFKDYIGKIITQDTSPAGQYDVIHFIDKKNRTSLRITGLNYKNFDKIQESIPLKTIDFNPTMGEYWKLSILGRITIKESSPNKGENKQVNKMLVIFQVLGVIGLLLFIVGTLLSWLFT